MTDIIEQDALANTPDTGDAVGHDHTHEAVKSIVMTPRVDEGLMQKVLLWFGAGNPNAPLVCKAHDGLRRMLLFTSNSYKDRENETITSKALEEYEASCYPGEGLYHNDNPMLFWHDDDIPMGTIEAVEYIAPFLVEVGQELPNDPISKALWDFAEKNGDKAGVSHRFGYLEKDRDEDGTFHRIFKQETSYLPERSLAANGKTYAGVLKPMSIPESRKRLGSILAEMSGDPEIETVLHDQGIPAVRKRLAEQGLQHKAAKPPFPPKDAAPPVEGEVMEESVDVEEDAKEGELVNGMTIAKLYAVISSLMNMMATFQDVQAGYQDDQYALQKAMEKALEERVSEKAIEKTTIESLEARVKALEAKNLELVQKMNQAPKSVQNERGQSPQELETSTNALVNTLKTLNKGEKQIHPIFGIEYDPSKIPDYSKKE